VHGFVLHLTAASVVAHAVLGCCWHHVHACGHAHGAWAFVGSQHGDRHDEHAAGASDSSGTRHSGREECRGSKCHFLPAKDKLVVANEVGLRVPDLTTQPVALPGLALESAAASGVLRPDLVRGGVPWPAVRLHLAHQVLLI
jgi:hypothetical protein